LARHRGAPQGTPKAAVDRFEAAIKSTVESLKFVQACIRLGARPAFLPADKFGRRIAQQDAKRPDRYGLRIDSKWYVSFAWNDDFGAFAIRLERW
jgi:hypothetical protein